MTETWVTIATYTYAHDAYIYTARLNAEGIEYMLKNELMVQSQHLLSNATGGIDLQVKTTDKERALTIITDETPHEEFATKEESFVNTPEGPIKGQVICPHCNSAETRKEPLSAKWFAIGVLLFGFPLLGLKRKYYCFSCKTIFIPKQN